MALGGTAWGATVTFENSTDNSVTLYCVDPQGAETRYVEIAPGEQYEQAGTSAGHVWRFKVDGETIQTYAATADATQQISISVPGQLPGDAEYAEWLTLDQPALMPEPRRSTAGWIDGFKGVTLDIDTLSRRGYHLLRLNPSRLLDTGLRAQAPTVFQRVPADSKNWDVEAGFMMPNEFLYTPVWDTEGSRTTNLYFSESERTSAFAFNVSVSASQSKVPQGGDKSSGPKVGASHSQRTEKSAFSRSETVSIMATRWGAAFWITARKDEITLSELFRREALKLGDSYADYVNFFETFGTHYPLSTLYGGMAFYEEFTSMEEVGKSLSKSTETTANATVPVKGVDVATEIGFSTSNTAPTAEKEQRGLAQTRARGGTTGSNFEEWMLPESETRNLVPIKVDLRPIWELVWPAKFEVETAADAQKVLQLQATMQTMLERYLEEESRKVSEAASRKPRIFSVRIDSIKLDEDGDDGQGGPDLWGYIDLYAARYTPPKEHALLPFLMMRSMHPLSAAVPNPENFLKPVSFGDGTDRTRKWSNWKTNLRTTLDSLPTITVPLGDFPNVNKQPSNISITPVVNEVTRNGRVSYQTDFQLDQYRFYPYGYLRDDDVHPFYPEREDDWTTLDGRSNWFTLQDVVDSGGQKSATVSASADGLGTVKVRYTVREVDFRCEVQSLNLPEFLRF